MAALLAAGTGVSSGCDRSALGEQSAQAAWPESAKVKPDRVDRRAVAAPAPRLTDWTADGCPMPSDSPRAPIGKSADRLVREYGPTARDVRFTLGEAFDPVRMSVRNVLSTPADLRLQIREQAWERAGCELRVWSTMRSATWTAVHSLRSEAGGEH